jgi:DNA topoisomerase-1
MTQILGFKYERQKIAEQMIALEPSLAKKRPELAEPESEVDDEFIERYLEMVEEKEKKALATKLAKENEKRKERGEEEITEMDLDQKPKKQPVLDLERLEKKYEQMTSRIDAAKTNLIDKVR